MPTRPETPLTAFRFIVTFPNGRKQTTNGLFTRSQAQERLDRGVWVACEPDLESRVDRGGNGYGGQR